MIFMPIAYFLLNVALNHESDVIDAIKKELGNFRAIDYEIQGVFGVYDIVLKISSQDENHITKTAIEKIRSIKSIQSIITMIVNDDQP